MTHDVLVPTPQAEITPREGTTPQEGTRPQAEATDAPATPAQHLPAAEQSPVAPRITKPGETASTTVVPVLPAEERISAPVLPTEPLEVQDVPEAVTAQPVPLLRIIMPVVMILAMVAMVGFMVVSGSSLHPMMLLFPLMMGMSMLMMLQPAQANNIDEQRRTYLRHLVQLREQALERAQQQRAYEMHWHPHPSTLWSVPGSPRLWERLAEDPQCGVVRIGVGDVRLCTPLQPQQASAVEDMDPVCAVSLRHLMQRVNTVPAMPLTVQLQAFGLLAVCGEQARGLVQSLVAQACVQHGPELLAVHLAQGAPETWEWLKWLPHHCEDMESAAPTLRLVIVDSTAAAPELADAESTADTTATATSDGAERTTGADLKTESWLRELQRWATTIILVHPSEPAQRLALEEGIVLRAHQRLEVCTEHGYEDIGEPDHFSSVGVQALAQQLAGYRRPGARSDNSLDLRNLLQIPDLDTAALQEFWDQGHDFGHLAVPIGRTATGAPLVIDIKEAALGGMGPHGLCIGATGSGKSELLRTLVVALAATHSPEDLNFVLVDFKGGATFLGLDALPHTSAVITNLEEEAALVERMHDAIAGEMNRRQEFLRQAGNFANVREYNAQRTVTDPPLPALFIILDEFSELLGQHPDFADLFVAVGRLGRSLQIHLLLASQRLDEGRLRGLESHLSYRIGLKTFSAAESRQIVGTLDAYQLPQQPGHGYLRTDAGAPVRFRTSYVSGAIRDATITHQPQVRPFGLRTVAPEVLPGKAHTLVDDCVQASSAIAKQRGYQARRIWLPPLPEHFALSNLYPRLELCEHPTTLQLHWGIIDRPYLQRQDVLTVDFSGHHGHAVICGGPQSGKSTALRSLLVGLAHQYDPSWVRCYVLDFGGGALQDCAALPQVVAVAGKAEKEKVRRVIAEVQGLLARPAPWHTFLIIDDWLTLAEDYEDLVEEVATIVREGLNVRVHVVLSVARWMGLRPVIRDLIAQRIELKLVEPLDSLLDRQLQTKLPAAPGRGLWGKEQILLADTSPALVQQVGAALEQAQVVPAPGLKMLPSSLNWDALAETPGLVFALGGKLIEPFCWDPHTQPHIMMFGSRGCGKSTAVATLLHAVARAGREQYRVVLIDQRRSHLGSIAPEILAGYAAHTLATQQLLEDACITLEQRLPPADITPEQLQQRSWWSGPELIIVLEDADLLDLNALQRLQRLLPHSRDIGLHLMVTHKIGTAAKALYQPFLAELRDQIPLVLIFDGDREDGPLFHVRPDAQIPGRVHMVAGGSQLGMFHIAQVAPGDHDGI